MVRQNNPSASRMRFSPRRKGPHACGPRLNSLKSNRGTNVVTLGVECSTLEVENNRDGSADKFFTTKLPGKS
jgi:hypothetical protein